MCTLRRTSADIISLLYKLGKNNNRMQCQGRGKEVERPQFDFNFLSNVLCLLSIFEMTVLVHGIVEPVGENCGTLHLTRQVSPANTV